MGGDFNSKWQQWSTKTTDQLGTWAQEMGLHHSGLEAMKAAGKLAGFVTRFARAPDPVVTIRAGSLLDHILFGGGDSSVSLKGYWVDHHSIWATTSDHYPLIADVQFEGGLGNRCPIRPGRAMGDAPPRRALIGEEAYNLYGHLCHQHSQTDEWASFLTLTGEPSLLALNKFTLDAVDATNAAIKHGGNKRSRHKGGWSPHTLGLQVHQ